jgi:hypothetical protein
MTYRRRKVPYYSRSFDDEQASTIPKDWRGAADRAGAGWLRSSHLHRPSIHSSHRNASHPNPGTNEPTAGNRNARTNPYADRTSHQLANPN